MHRTHSRDKTSQAPAHHAAGPVFVDGSGRRQRRVRRLGRLLLLPAAGYVALLVSTAFGGPSVSSPYVPLPRSGDHRPGHADPTPAHRTHRPAPSADSPTATPGGTRTTAPASTRPASASPTAVPATPTATATHGKSITTHPVPTPTHTGHGRP